MDVCEVSEGTSKLRLPMLEEFQNRAGTMQGGLIAAFADCAGGIALRSLLKESETSATTNLDIKYIAPVKNEIFAYAEIVHKGKSTAVGEIDIKNKEGKLLAKITETFAILRKD
ncbi:hypothetical protein AKJ37_05015 [candidate division MSBL1 archaeon SCGC-AAA259I09]|uniref:Thioesterase domain-containing protein n=3 Tax=candidate division MSBL1 TaxID=215777 RepID=A0A133UQL0_9EURY|nr:hypothetical protein AKJ62_04595 [candidate division MSBL1 archaeon SCGC-AAA259D14]KXA96534.1 hypothetical protein AKJ37_05015 [candidate division MSBL1 archaeon SCGC-AAA259I09]KXA99766.1 hypothetical protein AKJ40_02455 [candidate division MSBL1 archaeon SCGC-AAA259M10]